MKSSIFFRVLVITMLSIGVMSCGKKDKDNDNNGDNKLPDSHFQVSITGAETHDLSFTLIEGTAGDYVINGSHSSTLNLMQITAMQLPTGWSFSIGATATSLDKGTRQMNQSEIDRSSFNPSSTDGYISTSGSVTITKSDFFASSSGISIYYIDGNFSIELENPNDPDQKITANGSFSGIAMGAS